MPRKSSSRERGSAVIEAAFITPAFLLLLFGVFEFGFLFRNSLATTNASREGARAASVHGAGADTDYIILETIENGIGAMGIENVEYVVVYNVLDLNNPAVPAACAGPSGTSQLNLCNRYEGADFDLELVDPITGVRTDNFGCVPLTSVDTAFCPLLREDSLSGPPGLVGVYIQTRHEYITGFIGDTKELNETTVIRIEPEES